MKILGEGTVTCFLIFIHPFILSNMNSDSQLGFAIQLKAIFLSFLWIYKYHVTTVQSMIFNWKHFCYLPEVSYNREACPFLVFSLLQAGQKVDVTISAQAAILDHEVAKHKSSRNLGLDDPVGTRRLPFGYTGERSTFILFKSAVFVGGGLDVS